MRSDRGRSRDCQHADALTTKGLAGSAALADKQLALEAECDALTARVSTSSESAPIDLRATLAKSATEFARMVDELPQHLGDRDTVCEVREALREWLGEFRIEPTDEGRTAF